MAISVGKCQCDVKVDNEGHFTGSRGSWFVRYKIMIVISPGASLVLLSRMWAGEQCGRWATLGARQLAGGYNTFYDNLLDENLQRAGFGAKRGANICDYRQTFISRLLHA